MRAQLDIPYSPDLAASSATRQALDVYAPDAGTDLPVIVYIHGGGWRYGDRKDVQHKPAAYTSRGYVFVSLGYRLVPEARYPGQCADLAQGLRWVHQHIADYGGRADCIHLLGWSAGGPLACQLVADTQYLESAGLPLSSIRSIIGLDGDCYQIAKQMEMTDPKTRSYLESVWGEDPKGWDDPSPITHLRPGRLYPRFMLVHLSGRPDSTWQSEAFATRCREVGATARTLPVDMTHEATTADLGCEGNPLTAEIYRFWAESST